MKYDQENKVLIPDDSINANWIQNIPGYDDDEITEQALIKTTKGGKGSGHHGHAGRPGLVGGSAPAGAGGGKISDYVASEAKYTAKDIPFYDELTAKEKGDFDKMLDSASKLPKNINEVLHVIETPRDKSILAMEITSHDPKNIRIETREIYELREISNRQHSEFIMIHNHPSMVRGLSDEDSVEGILLAANLSSTDLISQSQLGVKNEVCVSKFGMSISRVDFNRVSHSEFASLIPSRYDVSDYWIKKIENLGITRIFSNWSPERQEVFVKLCGTELYLRNVKRKGYSNKIQYFQVPGLGMMQSENISDDGIQWYKQYIERNFDSEVLGSVRL